MKKTRPSIFKKINLLLSGFSILVLAFISILFLYSPNFFNSTSVFIVCLLFFVLLIAVLYFTLRKLLSPIKIISNSLDDMNNGKSGFRVNIKSKDEFGRIAGIINNMNESIQSSEKAKESLLIDVSHELRTPLTRLKLSSEFIENEKVKNKIKEDVTEMEHMVAEILENYKKENSLSKPEICEFDLNELVENTAEKFITERINFTDGGENLKVKADKKKLELVIKNLIDNALKYSKDNIEIKTERNPDNSSGFILKVKDKGVGIPPEEIKYIFEPFYRVDKSRNKTITGYGLGLNIIKKIIEAHNGTIEVQSVKDVGTEFTVKI